MIRCGNWEAEAEFKTALRCLSWVHVWMVPLFTEIGIMRGRISDSFRGWGVVGLDNIFSLFLSLIF